MNSKPVLYLKHSFQAQHDASYVLDNYFKLLNPIENCDVLDVGCGPGNITANYILSRLPKSVKKLIGVDISRDFIEYAKVHYGNDYRISYNQMDILTDEIPKEYKEAFDYIFSLYCFHFIADHKKAINNLCKMAKPRSNILISFMGKSILFDIYQSLYNNETWRPYMRNYHNVVGTKRNFSKEHFEIILNEIGLRTVSITEEDKDLPYTFECMRSMLLALHLFSVPTHMEEDFVNDHMEYFKKNNLVDKNEEGEEVVHFPYTLIAIVACK